MQELLKNSLWVQRTNHFKIKLRSNVTCLLIFNAFLSKIMYFYVFLKYFFNFSYSKTLFYTPFIKIYLPLSLIYIKLYVFAKLSPRSFQICKNFQTIRYGCREWAVLSTKSIQLVEKSGCPQERHALKLKYVQYNTVV